MATQTPQSSRIVFLGKQDAGTHWDCWGKYPFYPGYTSVSRVVILGDTGSPTAQTLAHNVITRGLTIVGAHDVYESKQWNDSTISSLFFALATSGRFPLAGLTSHVFAPAECKDAYKTAETDRAHTMGALFHWANA